MVNLGKPGTLRGEPAVNGRERGERWMLLHNKKELTEMMFGDIGTQQKLMFEMSFFFNYVRLRII